MQVGFNLPISGPLSSPDILTRIAQEGGRSETHCCRSLAEFNITLPKCRLTEAVPDPKCPRLAT
jgi:hypothetical protein